MSTFEDLEISVESSRPIELFEIRYGSSSYRYASGEDTITAGGFDWEGLSISRGRLGLGPSQRSQTLEIRLPANNIFVQKYASNVPGNRATVLVYRIQRGDLSVETRLLFKGLLRTVEFVKKTQEAVLFVMPIEGGFGKEIPRLPFTIQCPLMLFDLNCKVIRANFLYTGSVSVVSSNVITVPGLDASKGVGWATAGDVYVPDTGERRFVTLHSATNLLTLNFPFQMTPLGSTIEVAAGCDRTFATCGTKFNNTDNYGGFYAMPVVNLFTSGVK